MGKDDIIPCHDCCKTHMQDPWQEYVKNKESETSVTNSLDAAKIPVDHKELASYIWKQYFRFLWYAANRKLH